MFKHISELLLLVEINLKVRYRQTVTGFLWVIFNPIVLYFVQAVLFTQILAQADSSYYFYLLTGLLPWFYISQTAEMGCNYIASNAALIKNLKVHPFKLISSLCVENYVNLVCVSLLIFAYLIFNSALSPLDFVTYLALTPWLLLIVILITFISSLLNILFKDTKYILHFIFTVLYFSTPTFFYETSLPEFLRVYLKYNPFYWIISLFRIQVLDQSSLQVVFINLFITSVLGITSFVLWKKMKNEIYLKI